MGRVAAKWVAFYTDTHHEVLKVESGYRISLLYNIYSSKDRRKEKPLAEGRQHIPRFISRIQQRMAWLAARKEQPGLRHVVSHMVGYICRHKYGQQASLDKLLGQDFRVYGLLRLLGMPISMVPVHIVLFGPGYGDQIDASSDLAAAFCEIDQIELDREQQGDKALDEELEKKRRRAWMLESNHYQFPGPRGRRLLFRGRLHGSPPNDYDDCQRVAPFQLVHFLSRSLFKDIQQMAQLDCELNCTGNEGSGGSFTYQSYALLAPLCPLSSGPDGPDILGPFSSAHTKRKLPYVSAQPG